MMVILESHSHRLIEYDKYLDTHISNVERAYTENLKTYAENNLLDYIQSIEMLRRLCHHDSSKYLHDEYQPYVDHFYPENGSDKTYKDSYDLAWLHHQKVNPHHWQYWVLVTDNENEKLVPLEMDILSVLEMLCDWSSFQYVREDSTANKWYEDNKDNMILNDKTRELVESILSNCPNL